MRDSIQSPNEQPTLGTCPTANHNPCWQTSINAKVAEIIPLSRNFFCLTTRLPIYTILFINRRNPMAKRTLKERMIAAILANGGKQVKVSTKTVIMTLPTLPDTFLYLGNSGSLRVGKTKTTSIPYDRLKAKLLASQP